MSLSPYLLEDIPENDSSRTPRKTLHERQRDDRLPHDLPGMFGERTRALRRSMRVEIPLIQRDYAQGRQDPRGQRRSADLPGCAAPRPDRGIPVGLDFIYGEVNDGTFEPLDGQQRLTTLFLLHWYLAFRRGDVSEAQPWAQVHVRHASQRAHVL